ncbi:MAG: hypothetical protein IKJ82_02515 [Oscillospiraceae bacterium]|nr:hypothetical protein [Oscillospiraceae bacterium]
MPAALIGYGAAATKAYKDAAARGATTEQAIKYGTYIGAADSAIDILVPGKLNGNHKTFQDFLKEGTAQAVKTTASSAANTIIDNQLMGELNRHKKLTEKYIAMGYSQAEAQHLALNSMGRGLLQEIVSEIMGEKLAIGRNDDEGAQ